MPFDLIIKDAFSFSFCKMDIFRKDILKIGLSKNNIYHFTFFKAFKLPQTFKSFYESDFWEIALLRMTIDRKVPRKRYCPLCEVVLGIARKSSPVRFLLWFFCLFFFSRSPWNEILFQSFPPDFARGRDLNETDKEVSNLYYSGHSFMASLVFIKEIIAVHWIDLLFRCFFSWPWRVCVCVLCFFHFMVCCELLGV